MNYHQRKQVYQFRKKKWNKQIWIASKIGTEEDDYGHEVAIYDEPKMYMMNVQPISSYPDMQEFGERAEQIQKAVIEYDKYFDKFKEFDLAYLDGASPKDETSNGVNANYRLYPPRNQNKVIQIYFERLVGK